MSATGRGSRQFYSQLPPFVVLPKTMLLDPALTPDAKVAWMLIVEQSWRENNGEPWEKVEIPLAGLADETGIGEKRLRKAVAELVKAGLVETWRRGQGLPNAYQALLPADDQNGQIDRSRTAKSAVLRAGARVRTGKRGSQGQEQEQEQGQGLGQELDEGLDNTLAKTRKRDPIFDALAVATSSDPEFEGTKIGMAAAKLRTHSGYLAAVEKYGREWADQAYADEVPVRARAYQAMFPNAALTPLALTNHWKRVVEQQPRQATDMVRDAAERLAAERGETL